jgi:hypothetical protein
MERRVRAIGPRRSPTPTATASRPGLGDPDRELERAEARSKQITLTAKARRITGQLAAEWRATEAARAELEAEIPYPLSRAVADIQTALDRKSLRERILERMGQTRA